MKKMSESQLLSWRPRQPSAGLKRRLRWLTEDVEVATARWLWSCVAPTMACALLALMALDRDDNSLHPRTPVAMVVGDQSAAAFSAGGERMGQNHLAAITFGWTNCSDFRSSIRFTPTTPLTN